MTSSCGSAKYLGSRAARALHRVPIGRLRTPVPYRWPESRCRRRTYGLSARLLWSTAHPRSTTVDGSLTASFCALGWCAGQPSPSTSGGQPGRSPSFLIPPVATRSPGRANCATAAAWPAATACYRPPTPPALTSPSTHPQRWTKRSTRPGGEPPPTSTPPDGYSPGSASWPTPRTTAISRPVTTRPARSPNPDVPPRPAAPSPDTRLAEIDHIAATTVGSAAPPPDGQLLRYADGRPITSRRYDHLWVRAR
jgi:hypothetical protein